LQEVIDRIKERFTLPSKVTVSGDFKMGPFFSFDKYVGFAYDWLKMGHDAKVKAIIDQAAKEYSETFRQNPADIAHTIGGGILEKSILQSLASGIGYILYEQLLREKLEALTKPTTMIKKFELERRTTFDKPYLKVFLQDGADYGAIATLLKTIPSVKTANPPKESELKKGLTVYPARAYDISDVEKEVEFTLTNYFNGKPLDQIFIKEAISSLSDNAYFQIIDHMLKLGKNLEAFKQLNEKFDEERYRDYFLPFLNSVSKQHTAKGEVFNRVGKTDILIVDQEGKNIFIAECKLWKGEAYLLSAVDQLLNNYVNWRDEKVAIIIFNRDVKRFSEVVDTAVAALKAHRLCYKFVTQRKDTSFSFFFKNPGDEMKHVNLELVLFNFA